MTRSALRVNASGNKPFGNSPGITMAEEKNPGGDSDKLNTLIQMIQMLGEKQEQAEQRAIAVEDKIDALKNQLTTQKEKIDELRSGTSGRQGRGGHRIRSPERTEEAKANAAQSRAQPERRNDRDEDTFEKSTLDVLPDMSEEDIGFRSPRRSNQRGGRPSGRPADDPHLMKDSEITKCVEGLIANIHSDDLKTIDGDVNKIPRFVHECSRIFSWAKAGAIVGQYDKEWNNLLKERPTKAANDARKMEMFLQRCIKGGPAMTNMEKVISTQREWNGRDLFLAVQKCDTEQSRFLMEQKINEQVEGVKWKPGPEANVYAFCDQKLVPFVKQYATATNSAGKSLSYKCSEYELGQLLAKKVREGYQDSDPDQALRFSRILSDLVSQKGSKLTLADVQQAVEQELKLIKQLSNRGKVHAQQHARSPDQDRDQDQRRRGGNGNSRPTDGGRRSRFRRTRDEGCYHCGGDHLVADCPELRHRQNGRDRDHDRGRRGFGGPRDRGPGRDRDRRDRDRSNQRDRNRNRGGDRRQDQYHQRNGRRNQDQGRRNGYGYYDRDRRSPPRQRNQPTDERRTDQPWRGSQRTQQGHASDVSSSPSRQRSNSVSSNDSSLSHSHSDSDASTGSVHGRNCVHGRSYQALNADRANTHASCGFATREPAYDLTLLNGQLRWGDEAVGYTIEEVLRLQANGCGDAPAVAAAKATDSNDDDEKPDFGQIAGDQPPPAVARAANPRGETSDGDTQQQPHICLHAASPLCTNAGGGPTDVEEGTAAHPAPITGEHTSAASDGENGSSVSSERERETAVAAEASVTVLGADQCVGGTEADDSDSAGSTDSASSTDSEPMRACASHSNNTSVEGVAAAPDAATHVFVTCVTDHADSPTNHGEFVVSAEQLAEAITFLQSREREFQTRVVAPAATASQRAYRTRRNRRKRAKRKVKRQLKRTVDGYSELCEALHSAPQHLKECEDELQQIAQQHEMDDKLAKVEAQFQAQLKAHRDRTARAEASLRESVAQVQRLAEDLRERDQPQQE